MNCINDFSCEGDEHSTKCMQSHKVKIGTLGLGDVVQFFDDAFGHATIYKKWDGRVHVYRPFVHTSDVVYSGNALIPYVGIEDFEVYPDTMVYLIRKNKDALR